MIGRRSFAARGLIGWLMVSLSVLIMMSGCTELKRSVDQLDQAVAALNAGVDVIEHQSDAWRDQLPQLEATMTSLEGQAASDVKTVLATTTNELDQLTKDTIKLAGQTADQLVAHFGTEVRCSVDFARSRVVGTLKDLASRLTFWKKEHQLPTWPPHAVCQVTPDSMTLTLISGHWSLSSPGEKIVGVYGYDFRADALPTVELQDTNGTRIAGSKVGVTFVTRYQIDLNFGDEDFSAVVPNARYVLQWPDQPEPNAIALSLVHPAEVEVTSAQVGPDRPRAAADFVAGSFILANRGDQSTTISASWTVGGILPAGGSVMVDLPAGVKDQPVAFPPYLPQSEGAVPWAFMINGNLRASGTLTVTPHRIYHRQLSRDVTQSASLEPNVSEAFHDDIQLENDCVLDTASHPAGYYAEGTDKPSPNLQWDAGTHVEIAGYYDTLWRSLSSLHAHLEGQSKVRLDSMLVGVAKTGKSRFRATVTVFELCGTPA